MAITKVDLQKVDLNAGKVVELTAPSSASDGFAMDFTAQDERTVFLFMNTSTSASATVKVLAGNGIQGCNDIDAFTIPAGGICAYRLDSGAFMNVTGDNKDRAVFIPSVTTVKGAVIQLP